MPARLVLVRHGATKLNVGGASAERVRGWLDVDLDTEGRQEAERLGREFKGKPVQTVWSSPLARALETAQKIADSTQAPLRPDICLAPWQLGEMQGQLVASIIDRMNYYVVHETEPPPLGEPFKAYRLRFLGFLKRRLDHALTLPPADIVVLVTHSRGFQVTKAWIAAGTPDDLTIDTDRMTDYRQETGTGGQLWLEPKP